MKIDVFKFGGVAVGSADAIRRAATHVMRHHGRLVIVVSAANGVTDLLHAAGAAALHGDATATAKASDAYRDRHQALIAGSVTDRKAARRLRELLDASATEMDAVTQSISVLRELTPRANDALVARGERMLAAIFAEVLRASGRDVAIVDAVDVIHTQHRLGTIWPDFPRCERAAKTHLMPLLHADSLCIVPGYIGRGPDGEVVTLGRGGSDFSAAILGRSLGATAVTLFKEVDGLLTADPKSVPGARLLADVHYREAAELAYYGAKVLHPRTMLPLIDRKIPLFVRNTFTDGAAGTRISADAKAADYPVRALTAIRDQALLAIEGAGMMGVPGVAGRAFTALSQAGHSVSMISQASSEASICFVVPAAEAAHAVRALQKEFASERRAKLIDAIRADRKIALVAVVGLGMRGRPGIAARTFSSLSLAGVNIVAIAQGASELNITMAVAEEEATAALRALHQEFQLDKIRPLADSSGRESKLTILGYGQIGRELAAQLNAQEKTLRGIGIDIRVVAVADRSGIRIDEHGFSATVLRRMAKEKVAGSRLFDRDSPLTLAQLQAMLRNELWVLPSHRPILVDLTSEDTAPLLQEALENQCNVVLANKKPLAVPQLEYDRLMETARERGLALRYEATAGAGLPILTTLEKLAEAGDRVDTIVGAFSGTLGFIMTALEEGQRFSDAVQKAWKLGYTEPDPREDLSGQDVARKALILARALGRRLDLQDIELESLFTPATDDADAARFIAKLVQLDDDFAARIERARRDGNVLRYVARIGRRRIRVGVEAVPAASPLGRLHGTDNTVVIESRRYSTNPLVVTGPGAGAAVTAAGVLNDIVAITTMERRRMKR